ncbi:hypothetical protein Pmani_036369 [Petrolisthes manimaculis]|uniref:protein-tyrosine-phosphatase n=1 Tax=Petrolisthes manimaculis TaxID=1843537 RepID=A0AAE1NIK6_9EUCA|nr:hypothetical protein Pmani_036369 [Petrolisthes manimaculis]
MRRVEEGEKQAGEGGRREVCGRDDYSRVELSLYPGVPGSDYINANYIKGASGSRAYIGSQGPLPHTVPDFWRMVVECEVQVIIMASNETEGGKHKCECYWVNGQSEERQFGNVTVTFVKARQVCPDFMVRTLKIKHTTEAGKTEERTICQFHYVLWPDHGVPETVRPLLDMVRLVRDCQASETLPVLVHCSAGCGRTGTICAIDYVWGLLRAGRLTENLNLFGLVKDMRRQRVAMVQTREQYILLHRAVRELFRERLKVIDAHPYENIATDGTPLILREKESDYEELYVKPEKQDESAKPKPPTTAPSVVSTPTGSLTRYTHTQPPTDYLVSSSPISNLERSLSAVPLLPHKFSKSSSSGVYGSPVPQPSPLVTHSSPLPQASPVSLPSPSQAQISYSSPTFQSNPPMSPLPLSKSSHSIPHGSLSHSLSNHALESCLSSKLGYHPHSKHEKEAENAAHKRQVTQPSLSSPLEVLWDSFTHSVSASPQHLSSNSATPSATPNNTPTPLHGIASQSGQSLSSPQLSSKSRTPSPRVTYRKPVEIRKPNESSQSDEDATHKSTEIIRRPSIAKLKELFEKSGEPETPPGVRLSRSASSVTSRKGLSVHPDSEGGFKVKRKSSLGAEETIQSKKAYEIVEKSRQQNLRMSQSQVSPKHQASVPVTIVSAAKPPSSPVSSSPVVQRRAHHIVNDFQEDGSTSALLAKVDDRPALPVKKSKSFRYARPVEAATNTIASTRSPELSRKKVDINTYFSLDRSKADVSSVLSKSESGNVNFIGDIPSPREGFKLSVYQMPNASNSSLSPPQASHGTKEVLPLDSRLDCKPQIPPKRVIGERFRSNRHQDFHTTPQPFTSAASASTSQVSPYTSEIFFSRMHQAQSDRSIYDCPRELQAAIKNEIDNFSQSHHGSRFAKDSIPQSFPETETKTVSKASYFSPLTTPKSSPTSDVTQQDASTTTTTMGKEYVNARVMRNPNASARETPKLVYVPVPTKRGSRDKPHEYANCDLTGYSHPDSTEEESSDFYMDPHTFRKGSTGKFPLYDEVMPSSPSKSDCSPTSSRETVMSQLLSASTPSATTPGSTDYEVMDFGESIASVDEVFETVNYELIDNKERQGHKTIENKKDFYSKKELDPIARQVFQDCKDYLLHSNNKSPVPSLMPKPQDKEKEPDNTTTTTSTTTRSGVSSLDTSMDVDEVKSKVNVAPQGLRTRERRNSYRQAVNPIIQNEGKSLEGGRPHPMLQQTKSIHKYEPIWFENGKHMMRRNDASSNISQDNVHQQHHPLRITRSQGDGAPQQKPNCSNVYVQVQPPLGEDHGPNLNQKSSNKDAQFREKLEELHTLVNNLERQKQGQSNMAWQRFIDDDNNSKGSGSSNSTLQSRSTSSSRSTEPQEPIYANAHMLVGFPSHSPVRSQQQQQRSTRHPEPLPETRSPPPIRHSRTEAKLDVVDSKSGRQSPLLNGSSLYGTIATTTFRSKQSDSAPLMYQNASSGKPPSPYNNLPSTATLPARTTTLSPTPYHSIPPPKGFGSGASPSTSPNPIQNIQQNRENWDPSSSSSPYYNMSAFVSGKPGQPQRPMAEMRQGGKSPYSNIPPNSAMARSRVHPPHQPSKARIVGDIAYVGEEPVRLRRPGPTIPLRSDGGNSGESRGSDGIPVAPPRIKRTSGAPRHSALDPNPPLQDRRSSGAQDSHRQTILTAKQTWPLSDDEPPPAIPAKTAAAYQYPDPPPPPPHLHPHHPPLSHHSPYMQPPPPKPVQSSHHPLTSSTSSPPLSSSACQPTTSSTTSASHTNNNNNNQKQHSSHKRPSQDPQPKLTAINVHSFPKPQQQNELSVQQQDGEVARVGEAACGIVSESTSDSSDDEGIFHKFTAPNFLRKWRTNTNKQISPAASSSPKSAFYVEKDPQQKENKSVKEQQQNKETGAPSPTSPKPLVKAFGKLRQNSKTVAANFKSYLSQRGERGDGDGGGTMPVGPQNGRPGGTSLGSPNISRGIQKSASSGPAINPFSQVVQEYKYPTPIPKKPGGPVELPGSVRSPDIPPAAPGPSKTKPRQQYL